MKRMILAAAISALLLASCGPSGSGGLKEGDDYQFGEYPQTLVTDDTLLSALSSAIDTDDDGYLNYGEKEYAALEDKKTDETNYFEVEPIMWKVGESGELISAKILDALEFFSSTSLERSIDGDTIYPNNYEYSSVRAFLNGYDGGDYGVSNYSEKGFIDKAFSEEEKAKIQTTAVDNSAATTNISTNQYACENTNDKVYLLSYREALAMTDSSDSSPLRMREYTDYAYYNGLDGYNSTLKAGFWWLRSPDGDYSQNALFVYPDDLLSYGSWGVSASYGLAPVMRVNL